MSTTRKPLNKPKKKRADLAHHLYGGRATAGGVNYEVRIAALIATKMLAGDRSTIWDGISGLDAVAITMQAPEPVDDILVSLRSDPDSNVFISAKERAKTIPLTAKSPAFVDTVNAFVRQFLKLSLAARTKSRLVWAFPSSAGRAATQDLATVLDSHREDAGDASFSKFLRERQVKQRNALVALLTEAKKRWKKETEKSPTECELRDFLRLVHVETYEFECGQRLEREAEDTIRTHIVADPEQAKRVWGKLEHFFAKVDQRGVRVTAASLRGVLAADGLTLKSPPNYADDIAQLNQLTKLNLSRLKEHTTLRFGSKPTDSVHIHRSDELSALLAASKSGHHLITGEPGCGKSGLIHSLVEALQKDGAPVVLLLAEEVFGRDWKGSANLPGLKHALDNVLANWPDGRRGFFVTDALDALRDVEMQKLLRRLLHDVKEGQSEWTVVASVREFDLKHSRELREAFPGAGVSDHCSNEFSGVAHFHLTGLSDTELDELVGFRSDMSPFIESARRNPKSGGIHRSPFFLRLAAELLRDGVTPARLADWNSPAVLLRKFWEARLEDGAGATERVMVLNIICRQMLDTRSMALSTKELSIGAAERTAIHELRSREILQAPLLKHGTRVGEEDIRFSHHLLHDYAIARSVIPTVPERFANFAIREPLLPVFYRQSFMFALEELWDTPAGPAGYWSCALKLEDVAQLHSISRILAPILAARRVEALADLEPLLNKVTTAADADSPAQKALRHLASGLQDAAPESICTGAGAWCAFAERLASILPTHPIVEGPLVHILARINEVSAARNAGERLALNVAGRELLAHHIAKEVAKGWRYAALTAIDVVCKTFGAAPVESEQTLLSLLTPHRLVKFPHNDLFDLSRKIQHLGTEGETIVCRLFGAAFSTEPRPGDWENFGGAIMPMRMQTSDNWNSIHFSLAEYYEARDGKNAGLMTDIACIAWNAVVRRREESRESRQNVMATIQFRGVSCDLIEDYGHIWGRNYEHEENRILSRFEKLLREWAAAGDNQRLIEMLDQFARRNRSSLMWMVIMEAGAEYPTTLGVLLEEALSESLFLTHSDYSYGGTALLGALHKTGDSARRERLERLILDLPKNARFFRDEPRDPMPSWVKHTQDRLLGALEVTNVVIPAVRELREARSEAGELPANRELEGSRVTSHTHSGEELVEKKGIRLKEPANGDLFRLREALTSFIERDGKKIDVAEVERRWWIIGQCERALRRHQRRHAKLARELWGDLVSACESIVRHANWPAGSQRWKTVRRILLKAVNDPSPKATDNEDAKEDRWPSWGSPAPRLDAAGGLPYLAFRLGRADRAIGAALRKLCRDKSHPLRFNLARTLAVIEKPAPLLMWKLIDIFVTHEKKFSVMEMVVHSLDRLWTTSPDAVLDRLQLISQRTAQYAPADNGIHEALAYTYLFRFLRTGDAASEEYIARLIYECDNQHAIHPLERQLHNCRSGGWLTAGNGGTADVFADAVRQRTWTFFSKLLSAAQERLHNHRNQWQKLHQDGQPDTEAIEAVKEGIDRTARLVDSIAVQLYFASGAFIEKQSKDETRLSDVQLKRFWKEAAPLLEALSSEPHPHTAHHLVQTLHHLLPCAPREVFIAAAKCICTSASVGFQHESLAVGEVVKLIQRALADHREIFQSAGGNESQCLESLLKVLDLFVEAGWPEARELTNRLEEIYR
jgi:hypothetical protein